MPTKGHFCRGYQTQSAGTAITELIPGHPGVKALVRELVYRVQGTAHTLTLMRPIAETVTNGEAKSGQKTIVLKSDQPGNDANGAPEALVSGDWLGWKDENGDWQFDVIGAVPTTPNGIDVTTNLPTAIPDGAKVWCFYEVGRSSHRQFTPAINTLAKYETNFQGGIATDIDRHNTRSGDGDPLIFHSDNIAADGFLEALSGDYVNDSLTLS